MNGFPPLLNKRVYKYLPPKYDKIKPGNKMSKLVAEYLQHPLSASANIALLDDGNVGGVLGATLGSKLNIAGGKILQIVRATDTTQRTTTSTSFVDVTGMSVTITPTLSSSTLLIVASYLQATTGPNGACLGFTRLTTSGGTALSGAENTHAGSSTSNVHWATNTIVGYHAPATTSAVTYKMQFSAFTAMTTNIDNQTVTGQLYAIEVSA